MQIYSSMNGTSDRPQSDYEVSGEVNVFVV